MTVFLIVAVVVLALGWVFYDSARTRRQEQQLRTSGTVATVAVQSARQTGSWVANNPELALQLTLRVPGQPEQPLSVQRVVPVHAASQVVPGAVLRVRVDPQQPQAFVFDEPWAVGAPE